MAASRKRRLAAILVLVLVLLSALELVKRRFDPYLSRERGMQNPFWQEHPTRGHSLKPGDYGSIWGVPFHINRLGFRGPEISREKPKGVFRVLCLGDSITMGAALPEDVLYPAALQKILSARYPSRKFEVINAGVSGYMIEQELLLLKDEGFLLSPDLVVLQYTLYDPAGTEFYDHINPRREIALPGKKFLLAHLALARYVQEKYNRFGLRRNVLGLGDLLAMKPDSESASRIEHGWQDYLSRLSEMARLCRENHTAFLVLVVPHRAQFEDRRRAFAPQQRLAAFGKDNQIAIIDPAPAFAALKKPPYVVDPVHPDMQGHEIMAEMLADWVGKNLLSEEPAKAPE